MVNKCCYPNCRSGYQVFEKNKNIARSIVPIHKFPSKEKQPERFNIWVKFTSRKDLENKTDIYLCGLHFEKNFYKFNNKDRPRLLPDAVPTIDNLSRTIPVAIQKKESGELCFQDHVPKVRKNNFDDIFNVTDPDFNVIINEFMEAANEKFKTTNDLLNFLSEHIIGKKWVKVDFGKNVIKFAYFPLESPNGQSVASISINTSIDISKPGIKSNLEFFTVDGKLNPKILAKFFKRPYVFKQKEEVVNVFEFFEKNWDKLKNCNHERLKIDQIRKNFYNCLI